MGKIIEIEKLNLGRYSEVILKEEENYLFKDEYKKIEKIFQELLESKNNKDTNINNIISIIGDRGAGKSSFMKSFLKKVEKEKNVEILSTIDPSKFIKGTETLELIVGYIFKEFKNKLNDRNFENEDNEKRDLLSKFSEIHKGIKYIKGKNEDSGNSLDELLEISEAINLDENIKKLIEKYLKFIKKEKLVISIDDLDLNTQHVYQTIEYLRKYLMGEQVIILLAVKYEQLEGAIKESFYKEYSGIKTFYPNGFLENEIDDRAYKYLLKFLPYDRRVYLSSPFEDKLRNAILEERENKLIIKIEDETKEEIKINKIKKIKKILDEKKEITVEKEKEFSIERYINLKIKKICPENSKRHELIPNNLRELIFFVLSISKISETEDEKKLEEFKRFFFEYWISEKLNYEEKSILKQMDKEQALSDKNRVIYTYLENLIYNGQKKESEILDIIRIGDVRSLMSILKRKKQHLDLIFALEVLYNYIFKTEISESDKGFFVREIDTLEDSYRYDVNIYSYSLLNKVLEDDKENETLKKLLEPFKTIVDDNGYLYKNRKINSLTKEKENIYERVKLSNVLIDENLIIDDLLKKEERIKTKKTLVEKLKELKKITVEDNDKLEEKIDDLFDLLKNMYELRKGSENEEGLNEDFKKYKEDIIKKIIDNKNYKNKDLINNILFTLKTERENRKYQNPLEYFLKGAFSEELDEKVMKENDKDIFLGVIGEFYKRDILKEQLGIEGDLKNLDGVKDTKQLINMEKIIDRLDEKGSFVELLQLNDLTVNEGFTKDESDIIERFIKKNIEWYKEAIKAESE
ncbi:MAG: hypothetical protein ACRC8M_03035 [Cetobacterium sp.]|uniref:hypothetical protein n=1 Tax=Cetobacterium sp. TaxID=2071632 RepID=UPI003F332A62